MFAETGGVGLRVWFWCSGHYAETGITSKTTVFVLSILNRAHSAIYTRAKHFSEVKAGYVSWYIHLSYGLFTVNFGTALDNARRAFSSDTFTPDHAPQGKTVCAVHGGRRAASYGHPQPLRMETKRDLLTIKVMKMKKAGLSQEEVNDGLRQLITNGKNVPEDSRLNLYNSVMRELEDLVVLTSHPS